MPEHNAEALSGAFCVACFACLLGILAGALDSSAMPVAVAFGGLITCRNVRTRCNTQLARWRLKTSLPLRLGTCAPRPASDSTILRC